MQLKGIVGGLAAVAALLCAMQPAAAETNEIRLARQFSIGYLQLNVMQHQKLIEKHAAELGIPNAKVSWYKFNGPTAVNEALISGNIDIGSGGVPGLITLWARTKGTPQEIRGVSALSSQPFLLNVNTPRIKTIADFTDKDRIAVPAVKSSVQAMTLEMAAAKALGVKNFDKLDPLTISMRPPDATVALMHGGGEISAVFGVPPFQYQMLEDPKIHTVLNSFDVMGGSHTFTAIWTSKDRVGAAGALDHGAGEHHEVRRVHGQGRAHQGKARVVERLFLSGGLWDERELSTALTHSLRVTPAKAGVQYALPFRQAAAY